MNEKLENQVFNSLNDAELRYVSGGGIVDTIRTIIHFIKNPFDPWI